GAEDRVCVVLSYDPPGAAPAATADRLNTYLYTTRQVGPDDPNYRG
ncbi:MAG: hypothetical protein HYX52_05200, partial [Chloroflexi bacterium]|nr:hypothetical protein [Chloroflexota bacterium]